jgi:hypothetical protein
MLSYTKGIVVVSFKRIGSFLYMDIFCSASLLNLNLSC